MALPRASTKPNLDFAKQKEAAIALRAENCAAKAAEKTKQAEELKEMGDDYFRRKEYITALQCYTHAVHINGSQPTYMANMAAALLRLERFEDAEARKGQNHFHAAILDFENVIAQDPTNADALAITRELYQNGKGNETGCETEEEEFPPLDADTWEIETASDSSDYQHDGNGLPCRYYNHGGCKNGSGPLGCMFKHSPDDNSMRDKLGRNVCLNFATGACKYGYEKCRYSHDVRYLDDKRFITASQKAKELEFVRAKGTNKSLRGMGYGKATARGKAVNASHKKQNPPVDDNSTLSSGQTTTNGEMKATATATIVKKQSPRVDKNKTSNSDQTTTSGDREATDSGALAKGSHKKQNPRVDNNKTSRSDQTTTNGDRKATASGTTAGGAHKKHITRVYNNESSTSGQTTTNGDTRGNVGWGGCGKGRRAGRARHDREMVERMMEGRMMNGGFIDTEMSELLCQGVKTWDDEASDVLHALNAY